ncbi:hypothetical protein [Jiangella asiatica]|uniref:Uncharacterized protein n=1 Tax=Jiangella asiatica TaxID=2530372 RepID=A0A4R5CMM6_9ACTN|nr:hypothetical protein [Jiangella asiatica]TDE01632.1 hypothetical protein E1269_22895 [Jiangella asiatica]
MAADVLGADPSPLDMALRPHPRRAALSPRLGADAGGGTDGAAGHGAYSAVDVATGDAVALPDRAVP